MGRRGIVFGGGVAVAVVLGVAITANVTGAYRMTGGPLGPADQPDGRSRTMALSPDPAPWSIYTTVLVANEWPVEVRLESVRPLVVSTHGGVEVIGAQPYDVDLLAEDQQLVLGSVSKLPPEWAGDYPVTGAPVTAGSSDGITGTVVLVRAWQDPGWVTDVAGYEIDYRVGPFAFRTVTTLNSLVLCTNDSTEWLPEGCDDREEAALAADTLLSEARPAWTLGPGEGRREERELATVASAAGFEGNLPRAFVFDAVTPDGELMPILVTINGEGEWIIATPLPE